MIFGPHINKYYKKYWYYFAIGFLCLVFVDIIQLLIPLLVSQMVGIIGQADKLEAFKSFALAIDPATGWFVPNLGYTVTAVALIGIGITLGRIGWRLTVMKVGNLVECDLRQEMFDHVEALSIAWFAKQKTGGLMAYFTNDLEDIAACTSQGLIYIVDVFVLGISSLIFMFAEHWVLALICLIPIAFLALSGYFVMKGETKRWDRSQKAFQDMSDLAQESISGLAVVKAFVREKREMERFNALNGKLRLDNIEYFKFSMRFGNICLNILIYATILIILAVGSYFAINPQIVFPGIPSYAGLTPSQQGAKGAQMLTAFYGYYSSLIWPLSAVTMLIDLSSRGKASLNRVSTILDAKNDLVDSPSGYAGKVKGDIEYRGLYFAFPDSPKAPVLKDISFKVKAGENFGIVGKTGSGKSVLLTLLLKLYNVPKGMLFIDGKDIGEWYGKALRDQMGFVSQEAFLFSDTIAGNIAFGVDAPSRDLIRKSAKFADVDSNILELPQGYETLVGERGKAVSGGQRQRISMARAVARDPSVLVLDDSVSAVDAITEKRILANIKAQRKGRTTFIISSRLSAVEDLDGIIVLDHGQVVGVGTHQELLKTCPVYQKLYALQMLQKELA